MNESELLIRSSCQRIRFGHVFCDPDGERPDYVQIWIMTAGWD
jgi:hypothetical protein